MSKSDASQKGVLYIDDEPDVLRKKIQKAKTDSLGGISYEESRPALANLLRLYAVLAQSSPEAVAAEYACKEKLDFKEGLAEVVIEGLAPIRRRLGELPLPEVKELLRQEGPSSPTW